MPTGSPLIDQYRQDGMISPPLRRAMDMSQDQLMPLTSMVQPFSGSSQPAPAAAPSPVAPPMGGQATPQPKPPAAAPTPPAGIAAPNPSASAASMTPAMIAHQKRLDDLTTQGSRIDQIHNPWVRTPLKVLDAIGSTFLPALTMGLPGTQLHHQLLTHQAAGDVARDQQQLNDQQKRGLEAAQTTNQEAIPELKQTQAENTRIAKEAADATANRKLDDAKQANLYKERTARRKLGEVWDEDTQSYRPVGEEDMTPGEKTLQGLQHARAMLATSQSDYAAAKASNEPKRIELAAAALANATKAHEVAERNANLRALNQEARYSGTQNGVAIPGAMQDPSGQTVGTAFQQNVRPTGTQRDAAGRADSMLDLDARIRKALQNPELVKGTGPLAGRLAELQGRMGVLPHDLAELKNDLVSYGAFQAGLHPVRGIGALEYFDKVMGGLGQDPEQLLGKLDSAKATANSVKRVGDVPLASGGERQEKWTRDPKTGKVVKQ